MSNSQQALSAAQTDDKAGQQYWDRLWDETELPQPIDPHKRGLRHHARQSLHAWFAQHMPRPADRRARVLEVGCARSAWLPYFAREFGCDVAGLDYSELGCRQAEAILQRADVNGTIVCADLFDPPADMLDSFDAVVTFGVVEHFENTAGCVRALGRFLRPGGKLLTIIPNNMGAVGWVQRTINKPVFDLHVLLGAESLAQANADAGLIVESSDYLMSTHFAVTNLVGVPTRTPSYALKKAFRGALISASVAAWAWEQHVSALPATRTFSPYVACVARRSEATS